MGPITVTECTRKVVLEKVEDPRFSVRYNLRVQDSERPEEPNLLASTYAKELDGLQLLVLNTPYAIKWRVFPHDAPFGIARDVQEADRRAYEKLKSESLKLAKQNGFQEVHDLVEKASE